MADQDNQTKIDYGATAKTRTTESRDSTTWHPSFDSSGSGICIQNKITPSVLFSFGVVAVCVATLLGAVTISTSTQSMISSTESPTEVTGESIFAETSSYVSRKPEMVLPKDFVWGVATSSFQIEGGSVDRAASIWDTFCHEADHCSGDDADVACDHYHLYEQDVANMRELGVNAYRFSISWPRIFLDETTINQKGVDFYNRLIDRLLESGIVPWVTLFHWDLPDLYQVKYGGWAGDKDQMVDLFGEYARFCFEAFGDRVRHWITLNEPSIVAAVGYTSPDAPCDWRHPDTQPYLAAHSQLLAHARAYRIYHQEFAPTQKGVVGITLNAEYRYPLDPNNPLDVAAAERALLFELAWFADPIFGDGDYPSVMRQRVGDRLPTFLAEEKALVHNSADFFALNTYSSWLAAEPTAPVTWGGYWGTDIYVNSSKSPDWPLTDMEWPMVPQGAGDLLRWIKRRYPEAPPIYITENGAAEPGEDDVEVAIHDEARVEYYRNYIRQILVAGGDWIRGYFAWSLMDNFEWSSGFSKRFGIIHVNFTTLERTWKSSAYFYQRVIATNGQILLA